MKLPSFQFYPGDWRKDPNLARCSHEEKGVWIEMLCLMFECDERGLLATAGQPWTNDEIVSALGGDYDRTLSCVTELLRKGVARRNASGAILSMRMVRDEHKRKLCAEAGKNGGGNPKLKTFKGLSKGGSKGPPKVPPPPSSSASSSSSKLVPLRGMGRDGAETPKIDEKVGLPGDYAIRTVVQQVVSWFKVKMGQELDDRNWDKVYFPRFSRSAKDLLTLFENDVDKCMDCIDAVVLALEKKSLSWTPETVVKHASDWQSGRLLK